MSRRSSATLSSARHAAIVIREVDAMRAAVAEQRLAGRSVGVVPTMGAIHEGHLSLVDACVAENDVTVATVFLNPLQFGDAKDWDSYPRAIDADVSLLSARQCDFVFVPDVEEMYRPGHDTYVEVGAAAATLEGASRPGHFRGVATVVLKILQIVPAERAYFGQKDYQQTVVVKQMARDFDLPVAIRVCPTVREADGLALSSRNQRLSGAERSRARSLSQSLLLAEQLVAAGHRDVVPIRDQMEAMMRAEESVEVEYIAFVRDGTLEETPTIEGPTVIVLAARVGGVRLIDNRLVGEVGEPN